MENEINPQPLDLLMTRLGLTSADLVKASTEQLSFKMVNKGRKGRRLTPNIQDKILTALLAAKPDLKLKRKDLFRYELNTSAVEEIRSAISLVRGKEIKYPQFIDRLVQTGVTGYTAEVGPNRVTFYGIGGEAHSEQGPSVSQEAPGPYDEAAIRSAIADAQKGTIDHPAFLKRIHDAGIAAYEVNTRHRRIEYKGESQSYKERIPLSGPAIEIAAPKAPEKKEKKKAGKNNKRKSMTRKARMTLKKVRFKRRK